MRHITLSVFCALAFTAFSAQHANAASLIGKPCAYAGLGMTQMDMDSKNIVACLCDTNAHAGCGTAHPGSIAHPEYLVWKGMSNKPVTCPSGQALSGIVDGEPQCRKIESLLNMTCPAGQAVTSIANGTARCTKQGVAPSGLGSCAAKATSINSCVVYTQDQWGHDIPAGSSGSYTAPASAAGASYSVPWTCSEDDPYTTLRATVQYTGTATCASGTWYCVITRSFPMWNQQTGWQYPGYSNYYNGPC